MADDIDLNAGSGGAKLWTDEIPVSLKHAQVIKLADGTVDSATIIASGGGGETNALRVTLANDSTGLVSVDDGAGSLTVDNAGTFAVQVDGDALTALQLIDDVVFAEDVAAQAADKGIQILAVRRDADTSLVGTDNDYAPLQVDAAGALKVEIFDGGDSHTIDGTVTANLSATDNAVLDTIDAVLDTINAKLVTGTVIGDVNLGATDNAVLDSIQTAVELIDNAISGTEMQVDVVAALPAGTNAIGKLAANSGVDIGDVDVLSAPRATSHYRNIDANAEAEIKGSAGTLFWAHVINRTAAIAYLHLYDATAASVTPGTTTPDFTFAIPTQGDTNGAGFNLPFNAAGHAFANGITLVCTTTLDGAAGDPGTNGVIVNAGYA